MTVRNGAGSKFDLGPFPWWPGAAGKVGRTWHCILRGHWMWESDALISRPELRRRAAVEATGRLGNTCTPIYLVNSLNASHTATPSFRCRAAALFQGSNDRGAGSEICVGAQRRRGEVTVDAGSRGSCVAWLLLPSRARPGIARSATEGVISKSCYRICSSGIGCPISLEPLVSGACVESLPRWVGCRSPVADLDPSMGSSLTGAGKSLANLF